MINADIVDHWSGELLPLINQDDSAYVNSSRLSRLVRKGLDSLGLYAHEKRAMLLGARIGVCIFRREDEDPLEVLWRDNYVEVPIKGQHAREVINGLLEEDEQHGDAFYRIAIHDEVVMWPLDDVLFIGRRALDGEAA